MKLFFAALLGLIASIVGWKATHPTEYVIGRDGSDRRGKWTGGRS